MQKKPKKRVSTVLDLVKEKVNIPKLLNQIEFSESDMIDAAEKQPKLQWEASRYRVQRLYRRTRAEMDLSQTESMAGMRFRSIRDDHGKKELTEAAVKERIALDPEVRKQRKKLDQMIAAEELSKLLLDTFKTRKDVIRTIVDAGKISLHMKELELMRGSRALHNQVQKIRNSYNTGKQED